MLVAFIIWSVISVFFVVIAIRARRLEKPAGFWANAEPPQMADIKGYNKAVSNLFLIFAVLYEACGVPLLFCKQNSPVAFLCMLIVPVMLGTMIAYSQIEEKYKEKGHK